MVEPAAEIVVSENFRFPLYLYPVVRLVNAIATLIGCVLFAAAQIAPRDTRWAVLVSLSVLGLLHICVRLYGRRRARSAYSTLLKEQHETSQCELGTLSTRKVQCVVDAHTAYELRGKTQEFGDPCIFRRRRYTEGGKAAVVLFGSVVLNASVLERSLPLNSIIPGFWWIVMWSVLAGFLIGGVRNKLGPRAIFGTYLRIVPGRIDEMRARAYASVMESPKSLDLRKSDVVCEGWILRIGRAPLQGSNAKLTIDLREVDRPVEFLAAVLSAAATDRQTPEIPDNKLLG